MDLLLAFDQLSICCESVVGLLWTFRFVVDFVMDLLYSLLYNTSNKWRLSLIVALKNALKANARRLRESSTIMRLDFDGRSLYQRFYASIVRVHPVSDSMHHYTTTEEDEAEAADTMTCCFRLLSAAAAGYHYASPSVKRALSARFTKPRKAQHTMRHN